MIIARQTNRLKRSNVAILIDFDDSLLPSNVNYFGLTNDALKIFEINLKRLVIIAKKYQAQIVIISSWYNMFSIDKHGNLSFKQSLITRWQIRYSSWNRLERTAGKLVVKYLNGYVTNLGYKGKHATISYYTNLPNTKTIILEDTDFSSFASDNCLYCETRGLISGNIGYKIHRFLKPEYFEKERIHES